LHLFLIGGYLWLIRDPTRTSRQIEPEAMVLDLSVFSGSSRPAQIPANTPKATRPIPAKVHTKIIEPTPPEKTPHPTVEPVTDTQPKKQKTPPPEQKKAPETLPTKTPAPEITLPTPRRSGSPEPDTPSQQQKTIQEKRKKQKTQEMKNEKQKMKATQASKASQATTSGRFIRHNLSRIMRISQRTLRRLGIPRVRSRRRHVQATVSFRLHPDGAISGLHLSRHSGLRAIDRRTLQVIRAAYRRYPRPKVPVQVVITMQYRL
jgi:TonB family protein